MFMKKVYYFIMSSLFVLYLLQYTIAASAPPTWRKNFSWARVKGPRQLSSNPRMPVLGPSPAATAAFQAARAYLKDWQESVAAVWAGAESDPIIFAVAATAASCPATTDGALTVSGFSGGVGPYQVSLDGGKTYGLDMVFHQLAGGIYPVRVKDATGKVSAVQESVVGWQQEISFKVVFENAGCGSDAGGEIAFQDPVGGTAPYTYSINGGQTYFSAPGFSHLQAGQYLVQVKDAKGCSSQIQSVLLQQGKPTLTVSSTGASSKGSSTGTITAQAEMPLSSGGEMMSLAWGQPVHFQAYAKSFSPITQVSTLTFNQSPAVVGAIGQPISYAIEVYNAAARVWESVYSYGGQDHNSGGVWEDVYSGGVWDQVYSESDFSAISLAQLAVSFPEKPLVTGVRLRSGVAHENSFRNFFGTVLTLSGTSNTPETYSYSIDGGLTFQSSGYFTGLPAGTYTVLARNSKGCMSPGRQVTVAEPPALVLEINQHNPTCTEPESGSITLRGSGGTVIAPTGSPYTYNLLWPGADSFNKLTIPFPSSLTYLSKISFSAPGYPGAQVMSMDGQPLAYQLDLYHPGTGVWENVYTAQTLTGDFFSGNSIAFSPLTEASQIRFSARDQVNQVFSGFDKLQLQLEGTRYEGGTSYQYSIDGGRTYQAGNAFTGLKAGPYHVAVKDARGGVKTDTVNITLAAPCPNLSFALQTAGAGCDGAANGVITLSGFTGGRRPYQFSSDSGKSYQSDSIFVKLAAGSYPMVIKDALERVSPAQEAIIAAQKALSFHLTFLHPSCGGTADGKITIDGPAGGTAPYSYSIDGGATFAAAPEFQDLKAGIFQVQVKDALGCRSKSQAVSLQDRQMVLSVNPVQATCAGSSTGSIQLAASTPIVSGGQIGLLSWVAPASFKNSSRTFTPVSNATALRFNQSDARVGSPGQYNSYTIDVYNTQSSVWEHVYSYSDVGVISLSELEVSLPGSYGVGGIRFSSTSGPADIFQGFEGAVLAFSGSRKEPETYAYSIDGGATYQSAGYFTGLPGGTYPVAVKDAKGCVLTDTVRLQVPLSTVKLEAMAAVCLSQAAFNLAGGSPGGGYYTGKGVSGNQFDPLLAGVGNHAITYVYQSAAGCIDSARTTLTVLPLPEVMSGQEALVLASGEARQIGPAPITGYTYQWQPSMGLSDATLANPVLSLSNPGLQDLSRVYQLTVTNPAGCASVASVTVTVKAAQAVTLALDSVWGSQNAEITVPIRVKNFKNILSLQGSIQWDSRVATFVGVASEGLPGLNSASFGQTAVANGVLTFSWHEANASPVTFSDGAVIFALKLKLIGAPGAATAITITSTPVPIEVTDNSLTPVPVTTKAGTANIHKEVTVAGVVRSPLGTPLSNVAVKATISGKGGQISTTPASGAFSFKLLADQPFTAAPISRKEVAETNGITTLDIVQVQRHILNTQLLSSPYRIIAADVNSSGSVTTLDIVLMRALILRNIASFPDNRMWAFVKSDYAFANPALPFPYDSTRTYSKALELSGQDFIGIKLGDVNDSWDAATARIQVAGDVIVNPEDLTATRGAEVVVPVKVRDFAEVSGYQFTLHWDPAVLEFSGVAPGAVDGVYGRHSASQGTLTTLWTESMGTSLSLEDGTKLFGLRFKVVGENGSQSKVEIGSSLTRSVAYTGSLKQLNIQSRPALVKVKKPAYALYQNYPNPFQKQTTLHFELAEEQQVQLTIYNLLGQQIKQFQGRYAAGEHFVTWRGDDAAGNALSEGTYYGRMQAGKFTGSIQIIHVK
jgi:hypothetical protein